ncbi:hypothetical protein ACQUQU_09970 [Thalassolituus sp. LLYu03]|uniref:hypothetical protein n=1 Tax=Thalassolituus sp. LLYu03 TaxID=3421656 RepID=UPI003D26E031
MKNFTIGLLYILGLLLIVIGCPILIYRAIIFSQLSGSIIGAVVGILLAVFSVKKMYLYLTQSALDALEEDVALNWKTPLILIGGGLVGTFISIYMAGLSVTGFIAYAIGLVTGNA